MDPVFNETVQIVEYDEGFDTEVFFMYVTLAAAIFLALFLVYTFLPGNNNSDYFYFSENIIVLTFDSEFHPFGLFKKIKIEF